MSGETKQRISELEAEIARLKAAQPTLRDQFAMAALSGMFDQDGDLQINFSGSAQMAYEIADAMLGVRNAKD
jgi:hypothetical protein